MNQTFSLSRFAQLNRWYWAANGRTYSLGLLALGIITILLLGRVLTFNGYDAGIAETNVIYFVLLFLPTLGMMSIHTHSVLHDQNSALLYLMLPASRTEKFTVAVGYIGLFLVSYSLFYIAVEALFFQLVNSRLPATGHHYLSKMLGSPGERLGDISFVGYILLSVSVLGVLSSLYFRQSVFVKYVVLSLGVITGLTVVYNYLPGAFFPGLETHSSRLFGDVYVFPKGQYANAPRLPAPAFTKYIFPWLLLGALWVVARIRFNEIER